MTPKTASKIADWVDRLHNAVIVFWLGGFAFYAHHPHFRHFHAWFIVLAGAHQVLLRNKCILTIVSRKLRGQTCEKPEDGFVDHCFARCGLKVPHWPITVIIFSTVAAAIATLIFWK